MQRHKANIVVAGFVEQDGKLLVIRERPANLAPEDAPVINQPAGHLEPSEHIKDAVVREVLEETGYHVQPTSLVKMLHVNAPDRDISAVYFLFRCELSQKEPDAITAPEVEEALWLTKEEIMARVDEHRSVNTTRRFQAFFNPTEAIPLDALQEIN